MGATLAPPRNQLDPFEIVGIPCISNAQPWRGTVRARGTLEASPKILWLLGNRQKPLAAVTFLRSRAAWSRIKYLEKVLSLVRSWFELRTMHTETLQNH